MSSSSSSCKTDFVYSPFHFHFQSPQTSHIHVVFVHAPVFRSKRRFNECQIALMLSICRTVRFSNSASLSSCLVGVRFGRNRRPIEKKPVLPLTRSTLRRFHGRSLLFRELLRGSLPLPASSPFTYNGIASTNRRVEVNVLGSRFLFSCCICRFSVLPVVPQWLLPPVVAGTDRDDDFSRFTFDTDLSPAIRLQSAGYANGFLPAYPPTVHSKPRRNFLCRKIHR